MLTHGQTTTWCVKVGMKAHPGRSDWLRRLRSRLLHPRRHQSTSAPAVAYASWDNRWEQLRPPPAEGALDRAAAHFGQEWTIMLYSSLR